MRTSNIVQNTQSSLEVGENAIAMTIDEASSVFLMDALGKLYSRPAQAVLREYLSNAVDAHKAKGGTLPAIQITLPEESYKGSSPLQIRDFGKGMSEKEFGSILSRYGASTKRDSNKMIGGFGLGAKAGFALSNEFFMTSYQQGNAIRVRFFKDNLNQGYIDVVERFQSNEPDGILVEVPIPTSNIPELSKHTLITEFPFFMGYAPDEIEIRPFEDFASHSVHNSKSFTAFELGGNTVGWLGRKSDDWGDLYGLVGKVAYKINLIQLEGMSRQNQLDKELSAALPILREFKRVKVIDIPIGSVDMPSAREEITYSDRTMKTLSAILCRYVTLLKQYLQKKLNSQKTKLDVLHFLSELQRAGVKDTSFLSWQGTAFSNDFLSSSSVTSTRFIKGQFGINSLTGYRMGDLTYEKLKLLSNFEDNSYGIFRITVGNRSDVKDVENLLTEQNITIFLDDRNSGLFQAKKALFIVTTKDDVLNDWMFNSTPLLLSAFKASLEKEKKKKEIAAERAAAKARADKLKREAEMEEALKAREAAAHASLTHFPLGGNGSAPSYHLAKDFMHGLELDGGAVYYWSEEEVEKFANVTLSMQQFSNRKQDTISLLFPFAPASLPNSFNAVSKMSFFEEENYFAKLRSFLRIFFNKYNAHMIVLGKDRDLEKFKENYPKVESGLLLVKQHIELQLAAPYSELMIGYNTIKATRSKDTTSQLKSVVDFVGALSVAQKAEVSKDFMDTVDRFKIVLKSVDTLAGIEAKYLMKLLQSFVPHSELQKKNYSIEAEINKLRNKYPLMMDGVFNKPSPEVVNHLLTYMKLCDNQKFSI